MVLHTYTGYSLLTYKLEKRWVGEHEQGWAGYLEQYLTYTKFPVPVIICITLGIDAHGIIPVVEHLLR